MTLQSIRDALLTVSEKVYHFRAPPGTKAPYLVWAEDGSGEMLYADGVMEEQVVQGTVDLFTRTQDDPLVARVQAALTAEGIPWRLSAIQYEDDTGLIHYEWVWEVCCGGDGEV